MFDSFWVLGFFLLLSFPRYLVNQQCPTRGTILLITTSKKYSYICCLVKNNLNIYEWLYETISSQCLQVAGFQAYPTLQQSGGFKKFFPAIFYLLKIKSKSRVNLHGKIFHQNSRQAAALCSCFCQTNKRSPNCVPLLTDRLLCLHCCVLNLLL